MGIFFQESVNNSLTKSCSLQALLVVGSWAAPTPDQSPAALYGAPPRDCPLQRVAVATGYGCEESQECTTQYEEKCSTEYDRQCRTEYDNKCSTSYESQCTTVEDQKCETGYEVRTI